MPQHPSSGREQRRLTLDAIDVRADATGDEIRVKGHAAVYGKPAWIGPVQYGFSEQFEPGAFKESINGGADVRYLFNHDPNKVLARTKSGTLRLREDGSGLAVDADVAPTSAGRDLAILLERGDVNQMSVGMQVLEDRWEEVRGKDGNPYELRTIVRAKLFDVSAVTYPAYEDTDASLRSTVDHARELRDARGVSVERRQGVDDNPPRPAEVSVDTDADGNRQEVSTPGTSATTAPGAPSPTPAQAGETPEGSPPPAAGPATATRQEVREGVQTLADSERPLVDLLNEHAFTNLHQLAPRILCPACKRPATATA